MGLSPDSPGVEEEPSQSPASAEAPSGPWEAATPDTAFDDDETADTASEPRPSKRGSRESVMMTKAKDYTKQWFATGSNRDLQQISGEDLRTIWWLSVRAMQARAEFKRRQLELSERMLKERRSGCASALSSTYATRYQWALFVVVHIVITFLIWSHFFLKKFRQQEGVPEFVPAKAALAPEDAGMPMPNYWKKRLVPPLEFGLMHAILWQMVWLPVTMSRHLLALAARTRIRNFIPLEHMTFFHISLGYTMCFFIIVATIVFFVFFGHGCRQHLGQLGHPLEPVDFCEKMQSEIMITGLCIFVLLMIVMASSFLRRHMPFEWFYVLHHLVFVMFGLAIAHTLDDQFRDGTRVGKNRSQDFRFIATTLSLYFLDRAWSFLTVRRDVPVQEAVVTSTKSMLTLVCKKPVDFQFAPGQYAYIQIPSLDNSFHPFSIGSAPEEAVLRFYIVVYKGQWTEKLADAIEEMTVGGVNIMGPFGPGFDTNNFVSVSAVGTGTGIVPMMSLMRERYRRLKLMNKELLQEIQEDPEKVVRLEHTTLHEALDHSRLIMLQYWWKLRCMRVRGKQTSMILSKATNSVNHHYMFDIIAHVVLLLDMCQGFWTFSWKYLNEMEFNAKFQKVDAVQWKALEIMSIVCIAFFLVHRAYLWANPSIFRRSFADVLDVVAVAFMLGTHFAWAGEVPSFYIAPSHMAVLLRGFFCAMAHRAHLRRQSSRAHRRRQL